jgi:AraC family transcriptional regulator of adaptative response/methylated-DNA-[protein]-cysteine methyltransferase
MPALPSAREMERAYKTSDESYDGIFYLGVRTTGVFCRPSCGARKPLPRNVEYFANPREALFAGYRPCKRCEPMATAGTPPAWVTKLMDEVDRNPGSRLTDEGIRDLGLDPARARRYFQRQYGMTFQAYCRGRRLGQALQQIRTGARIDDVALGHGYGSHSGFREAFTRTFHISPGKAHRTDAIVVSWISSPLGPLLAGATDEALVLLEFTDRRMLEGQFRALRRYFRLPIIPGENDVLSRLKEELKEYFAGTRTRFSVPLKFPGSDFQRRVWNALLSIPFGTTLSYQELSARLSAPLAQRAVGHANGLNRIAILIPCHRIVNKNGALGGYGGGVWRKRALLELERGTPNGKALSGEQRSISRAVPNRHRRTATRGPA